MKRPVMFVVMLTAPFIPLRADHGEQHVGITPVAPRFGEHIYLLFSCDPIPSLNHDVDFLRTRVRMDNGKIRVDYYRFHDVVNFGSENCSTWASIGPLPAGRYPVEVFMHFNNETDPGGARVYSMQFDVADIEARPGEWRPVQNYSGVYWNSSRSGENLTVAQSPTSNMVGVIFNVYGADGKPSWLYFVSSRWASAAAVDGVVYRVTGPSFLSTFPNGWPGATAVQAGAGRFYFDGIAPHLEYDLVIDGVPIRRTASAFKF